MYSSVNLYIQPQNDGSAAPGYVEAVINNAEGNGTNVVYTTNDAHGFSAGDIVNISGCTPVAYNVDGAVVTAITTVKPYTFTIASTVTATWDGLDGPGLAIDLLPTSSWYAIKSNVETYLADKSMVGTTITIQPPTYVPVYLEVAVVVDSAYKTADIKLSVYQALLGTGGIFSYDNNLFGDVIPLSSVTTAISNVAGVTSANVVKMTTSSASSSAGTISLTDNQIPYLTPTMLKITTTGGI